MKIHRRDTENTERAQREAYPLRILCVLCVSAVRCLPNSVLSIEYRSRISIPRKCFINDGLAYTVEYRNRPLLEQ